MFGFEARNSSNKVVINGTQNAYRIKESGTYNSTTMYGSPSLGLGLKPFSGSYAETPIVLCTIPKLNIPMRSFVSRTHFGFWTNYFSYQALDEQGTLDYLVLERITSSTSATHGLQVFGETTNTLFDSAYPIFNIDGFLRNTITTITGSDRVATISGLPSIAGKKRYYSINGAKWFYWTSFETGFGQTFFRHLNILKSSENSISLYDEFYSETGAGGGNNILAPFDSLLVTGLL